MNSEAKEEVDVEFQDAREDVIEDEGNGQFLKTMSWAIAAPVTSRDASCDGGFEEGAGRSSPVSLG